MSTSKRRVPVQGREVRPLGATLDDRRYGVCATPHGAGEPRPARRKAQAIAEPRAFVLNPHHWARYDTPGRPDSIIRHAAMIDPETR